jgi:hypothetical protein
VVAGSTGSVEAGGARAWRCADLGGLDLFRASVSEFAFRPHAHEEFVLALTETGAASPVYRRGRHAIGPGDLIVARGRPVARRLVDLPGALPVR